MQAYRKRVSRRLREMKRGLTRQSLFFLQDSHLIIYMTSSFGKKTFWFVWSCSIGSLSSRDSCSIDMYFRNISFADEDDDELVLCTGPDSGNKRTLMGWIETLGDALSMVLPIRVGFSCLITLVNPAAFNWVTPKLTVLGLTLVMIDMVMTLTLDELRGAFSMTREMLVGVALQYSVMPLSGYYLSMLLQLPSHYAACLILVACCPGGTASNVITYIAWGNVALSVLMTATSTVLAMVMTPFLTTRLVGQFVAVSAKDLVISTMQLAPL